MSNIMASARQPVPVVGMGVTLCKYTDREAGTVVRVSDSGKSFWFTIDDAMRTDSNGMSDCQTYAYKSNPNGYEYMARQNKTGGWVANKMSVIVGRRDKHYDYTF